MRSLRTATPVVFGVIGCLAAFGSGAIRSSIPVRDATIWMLLFPSAVRLVIGMIAHHILSNSLKQLPEYRPTTFQTLALLSVIAFSW